MRPADHPPPLSPIPNAAVTTYYGPDRTPVASEWHLLDDFRPTDRPDTAGIRLTVVRHRTGRWSVRVAAVGLELLGVTQATLARAMAGVVRGWVRARSRREEDTLVPEATVVARPASRGASDGV